MSINDSIEFVAQAGEETGEEAGVHWLARDKGDSLLGAGVIIRGFLVHAPDSAEGWVEIRDSATVLNPGTNPCLFRFQAIKGHTEPILFDKDTCYKLRNGLHLFKEAGTRVHVLIG